MIEGVMARHSRSRPVWQVMVVYWFVQYAFWLGLLTPYIITIPLKMGEVATFESKAGWLGLTLGIGGALAAIAAPAWGMVSDRTRARIGRRKLWIILGSVGLLLGLMVLAYARSPIEVMIGWLTCQVLANACQSALSAVMSDAIPPEKQGFMSALLGASTTAAVATGVFLTQYTGQDPLAMFIAPWLLLPFAVVAFVAIVPDGPANAERTVSRPANSLSSLLQTNPFKSSDFSWALGSRLCVMGAWTFVLTYQVYFLTDRLQVAPAKVATFMSLSTSAMGLISLGCSCAAGWISDRIRRRKIFVGIAAVFLAAGLMGAAVATTFEQFLIAVGLGTIGSGVYYAVDVALCVEVLPYRQYAARDMGLLMMATALPQMIVPIIGAVLLGMGLFSGPGGNYFLLFAFASACALAGALMTIPIRGVR